MLNVKVPTVKQTDKLYMNDKIMIRNQTAKSKILAMLNSGRFKWKRVGNYGSRELDELISSMLMRVRPFSKRSNYLVTYSSMACPCQKFTNKFICPLFVYDIDSEVVQILT